MMLPLVLGTVRPAFANRPLPCSQVICVSHCSKENTALRACIPPARISVIPNAVDAARFTPNPGAQPPGRITVVAMSRLVYRKGIDLIAHVIPEMCRRIPNMDFILSELHAHPCLGQAPQQKSCIGTFQAELQDPYQARTSAAGGDGPKAHVLEHMVQQHSLQGRVRLVGAVSHAAVRSFLVQVALSLHSPVGCRLMYSRRCAVPLVATAGNAVYDCWSSSTTARHACSRRQCTQQ